jgi:aspartate/methionine/tyrosine aminotransferase
LYLNLKLTPTLTSSNAGQIIWINISKFIFPSVTDSDGLQNLRHLKLGSDDEKKYREREGMVIQRLLQNGVFVAAGSSFFTEEFGWFRLTFTVTGGALEEGLERVRKTLQEVRKDGWAPPAQQTVEQGFKSLPIGIRLPGLSEI